MANKDYMLVVNIDNGDFYISQKYRGAMYIRLFEHKIYNLKECLQHILYNKKNNITNIDVVVINENKEINVRTYY